MYFYLSENDFYFKGNSVIECKDRHYLINLFLMPRNKKEVELLQPLFSMNFMLI